MIQPINSVSSFDDAPSFNHPQLIRHLYENGLEIDRDILRDILALPYETLFEDLSAMLDDANERYDYFAELDWASSDNDFDGDPLSFPLHALFLISEIGGNDSLDVVFNFFKSKSSDLEENKEFIEFWLDDHITATVWHIFFHLGKECEQKLADFLFTRNVYVFTKTSISIALKQMIIHCPERAEAVQKLYESVLERFLAAEVYDESVFDKALVAHVILDYLLTSQHPVLPLIKKLYDRGWVDLRLGGDYEKMIGYSGDVKDHDIYDVVNVIELYDVVVATWAGYQPEQQSVSTKTDYSRVAPWDFPNSNIAGLKIGRNEPCPCGSGKKYKKCCLE